MGKVAASKWINAPRAMVFDTIAHIDEYAKAVPHIVTVEFLTDSRRGFGTRFRETRIMNGREATTDLEVTEYIEDDQVRFRSDTHGTIWDSVFTLSDRDSGTELAMEMSIEPHSLLARITTPFITGMLTKAIEEDLEAVKTYCESQREQK